MGVSWGQRVLTDKCMKDIIQTKSVYKTLHLTAELHLFINNVVVSAPVILNRTIESIVL